MGVDNWSEAERDLYAVGSRAILDNVDREIQRQRQEWNEGVALDNTSLDDMTRAHLARVREIQEQQKQWLADFVNGGEQDVGHSPVKDAPLVAGTTAPAPAGPGYGQPNLDSDDIKTMSLEEFSALRARIGMANASGRGLFG